MLSDEEIKQLKSENESLRLQLEDINYLINSREEELDLLRDKLNQMAQLRSELDANLDHIVQMQNNLNAYERKTKGALKREASLEDELVQSVEMEKSFYEIKEKYESSKAAIRDMDIELGDAMTMYRQLSDANSRIAELESINEILTMENDNLKLDVRDLKNQIKEP